MMSVTLYRDIIKTIEATRFRDCQDVLEHKYPTISFMTLGSVLSNYVQKSMKINHAQHNTPDKIHQYYQRFKNAIMQKEPPGIILKISDDISISPVLVAKFILEAFLMEQQEIKMQENELEDNDGIFEELEVESEKLVKMPVTTSANVKHLSRSEIKSETTKYLRDTTLIPDRNLAYEVYLCTVHDDNYAPLADAIKRTVGKEYEVRLSKLLKDHSVLYLEEDQLRKQGYDKTPDFKLEAPIAIEGKVITWIESKATFGDEETHRNYVKDQLTSYYNRFGPGLVIYWLGYVETVQTSKSKGIFVCDHLPSSIVKYDPSI